MLKPIQWFVERMIERMVPVIGGLFASSVEAMHALGHAEQQSRLEDEARRLEADGKPEIAATLRHRAAQLSTDNPLAQAVPLLRNFAVPELPPQLAPDNLESRRDLTRLPDLNAIAQRTRRSKQPGHRPESGDGLLQQPGSEQSLGNLS